MLASYIRSREHHREGEQPHTHRQKKKKQVSCSGKIGIFIYKKNEKAKNSCDKSKVHKTFVCFA